VLHHFAAWKSQMGPAQVLFPVAAPAQNGVQDDEAYRPRKVLLPKQRYLWPLFRQIGAGEYQLNGVLVPAAADAALRRDEDRRTILGASMDQRWDTVRTLWAQDQCQVPIPKQPVLSAPAGGNGVSGDFEV
jgi:hypothetical protein